MRGRHSKSAFTLVELLVVIGIIAILVAISFPIYTMAIQHAHCAGCSTRMRALGVAFISYAGDNDDQLPGRTTGSTTDKWPVLLLPYIGGDAIDCYADPGDPIATKVLRRQSRFQFRQ